MQKQMYKEKLTLYSKNKSSPYSEFFAIPVLSKNNGNLIFSYKKALKNI